MKRLLALLALLLVGPAMAQEYVNPYANAIPTGNLVPDWSFDGPVGTIPVGWTQDNPPGVGGAIQPGCGGVSNLGQCYQFSYLGANLSTNIDLSQYKTNNFEFYFDFYYRMNCNNSIGGYCQNPNGPKDLFGASIQFFTTNGEAGYFNFIPIGPDYFKPGDPGVNELGYKPVGWYSSQSSEYLFTSAIINFYGQDTGFWGGYYGPALDRVNFHINYLAAPEPSQSVDCTTHPADPSCAIQIYTDPNTIATNLAEAAAATTVTQLASVDIPTTNTNTTTTTVAEPTVSANNTTTAPTTETTVAADPVVAITNPVANPTTEAAYRELTDEEKAAILADAISKSAIESALAIANTAAVSGSNTETTTTVTKATTNNSTGDDDNKQFADLGRQETQQEDASNNGMELLDTGRSMGQTILTNILASSADSATEANNQAENIVQSSVTNSSEIVARQATIDIDTYEVPSFSQDQQTIEQSTMDTMIEAVNNNFAIAGLDMFISDDGRPKDLPGQTNNSDLEIETLAILEMIKQSVNIDDDKTFEDVVVNTNFDPTNPSLVNTNNVMNLEILGVISNKVEEKSDAEKRAEEVTAANKEQQDEINKNYMDADQSGLVAAIGADADVSSYRKAMLPDNNLWYRSEDIYKNVSYKDNVRNMYFLEKGNTDTYKQMVEEQYK